MECSSLNGQLFKLNIITDPKYLCGYVTENLFHYVFQCLLNIEACQIMVNSLETYRLELTFDALLFGTETLEKKKHIEIVHIVQNYIKNSNRFFNY